MAGLYKTVLLMLLLGIFTCHGEITRPYYDNRPYNEEIDEYKTIELRCETDKTWKNTKVSWYYQPDAGKDFKTDPGTYIVSDMDSSLCGGSPKTSNWCLEELGLQYGATNLVLKPALRSDGGVFTCVETNLDDPSQKSRGGYRLQVNYISQPRIVQPWRAVQNGEFPMRCEADGVSVPAFTWFFRAEQNDKFKEIKGDFAKFLGANSTSGFLTINKFTSRNVGEYKCEAKNSFSKSEARTSLDFSVFTDWVLVGISLAGVVALALVVYISFRLVAAKRRKRASENGDVEMNNLW